MEADLFAQIEERLQSQGPGAVFEELAAHAREQLNDGLLVQTLATEARCPPGLPLIEFSAQSDEPAGR